MSIDDSHFDTWFSLYPREASSIGQIARDAYAAGMEDPTAQQNSGQRVHALHQGEVSRRTAVAVEAMDEAIRGAVNAAKDANVPQGFIVALLHAHATRQTAELL